MRPNLAEFTKSIIGRPFEVGKMDCLHMVYEYLEQMMELPDYFKDLANSIKELYELDRTAAHDALCESLINMLIEIQPFDMRVGDIVILTYHYSLPFSGIVLNNGNCLICSEKQGCISIPLHHYKIERILRCPA